MQREAANASQLRRNFEGSPDLYVPAIDWQYTRDNVMVMERIYGIPVGDIERLRSLNINFKRLAERGVEIFFTQVFRHNFSMPICIRAIFLLKRIILMIRVISRWILGLWGLYPMKISAI